MSIPAEMRKRSCQLRNKLTLYIDNETLQKLGNGFECFKKDHRTFSEYLRSILIEYVRSPYYAKFVK